MQIKNIVGLGLIAGLLLTGCTTNVPMIKNHKATYQPKLQSMQHWSEVAQHLASQKMPKDTKTVYVTVKVADNATKSQYEQALQDLVTQHIVQSGKSVVLSAVEADVTLLIHTQVVSIKDRRFHNESNALLYPLGALAGSLSAANNDWSRWAGIGYGVGAAAVIDAIGLGRLTEDKNPTSIFGEIGYKVKHIFTGNAVGNGRTTNSEVMSMAELIQSGRIISGSVSIAYFPSNASSQYYQQHPFVLRTIQQ